MAPNVGRCPNCDGLAQRLWFTVKVEGDGRTWKPATGVGICVDCRLFFHLLNDPSKEDPFTFAEVRPLVSRTLSALDRLRPTD